jgi:hypothetical protein
MFACRNGHEAAVRVLLENERVTTEQIGATDKVNKAVDDLFIDRNKLLLVVTIEWMDWINLSL